MPIHCQVALGQRIAQLTMDTIEIEEVSSSGDVDGVFTDKQPHVRTFMNSALLTFLQNCLSCIAAILVVRAWDTYRWKAILMPAAAWVILNCFNLTWHWHKGRKGLGQWPEPHGHFYDEWLKLPEPAGDYYPWLAERMGNREPWSTWVRLDRQSRWSSNKAQNDVDHRS